MAQAPVERNYNFPDVNPLEVFGVNNANLKLLKEAYPGVKFVARGTALKTLGEPEKLAALSAIIESILQEIREYGSIDGMRVRQILERGKPDASVPGAAALPNDVILKGIGGKLIRARTPGQRNIVQAASQGDLTFAVGPAGSGKTYTAVAVAVKALKAREVRKIVLTRPAVEAGEQLGFLPGDLKEKVDPFLRPLYDALEEMIEAEKLAVYLEKGVIEIAPLAYMRGRTLNDAFTILDEAQNATRAQLKMFLTRMGENSKIIVTGDVTQIDLPKKGQSGLLHALELLKDVKGIGQVFLKAEDVVRHPLVKKILAAYEADDEANERA